MKPKLDYIEILIQWKNGKEKIKKFQTEKDLKKVEKLLGKIIK